MGPLLGGATRRFSELTLRALKWAQAHKQPRSSMLLQLKRPEIGRRELGVCAFRLGRCVRHVFVVLARGAIGAFLLAIGAPHAPALGQIQSKLKVAISLVFVA